MPSSKTSSTTIVCHAIKRAVKNPAIKDSQKRRIYQIYLYQYVSVRQGKDEGSAEGFLSTLKNMLMLSNREKIAIRPLQTESIVNSAAARSADTDRAKTSASKCIQRGCAIL